jgi:hypothetical protein
MRGALNGRHEEGQRTITAVPDDNGRVVAEAADLVPQLGVLDGVLGRRVALLRVLHVVVHQHPELVARVVEGIGQEDAA